MLSLVDDPLLTKAWDANRQLIESIDSMSCDVTIDKVDESEHARLVGSYRRSGDKEIVILSKGTITYVTVRNNDRVYQTKSNLSRVSILSYQSRMFNIGRFDPWSLSGLRELQVTHESLKRSGFNPFATSTRTDNPPDVPAATAVTVRRIDRGIDPGISVQYDEIYDAAKAGLPVRQAVVFKTPTTELLSVTVLGDLTQSANGIYLPGTITYNRTDVRSNKQIERVKMTVRNMKVNQPIPADEFTVKYRPGMTVWDEIRDVEYKCDDKGQPVGPVRPIPRPVAPPQPKK